MNPLLSVVVVSWNIDRELPRTIESLSPNFQKGISADEYEIIVVDNGSMRLPDAEALRRNGAAVTVLRCDKPGVSPVRAINMGLNASVGKYVGVFIDGARLASPGLLAKTREALLTHPRAVVGSRGRYLGNCYQRDGIQKGYSQKAEDQLLERIRWTENGYSLFDISVFDESSGPTWFDPIAESNSIFMSRKLWAELGGYDMRFQREGGGLVNLDTWERACALPHTVPVVLLGEATFHQLHGGVMTNNGSDEKFEYLHEEYIALRGKRFSAPRPPLVFWGRFAGKVRAKELLKLTEERKIADLQREKAALASEVETLKTIIRGIETSKSWLLTAPLRELISRLRPWIQRIRASSSVTLTR